MRILIYKVGNIGDTVCAVPALVAIRKAYPEAHITLLTSPGVRTASGAKELLLGARYLDELIMYYADEIRTWSGRRDLVRRVRGLCPDLFIQLPDDWASFFTLFRNAVFARLVGVKDAFGFVVRTTNWFKNAQVDYTFSEKTETETLMDILNVRGNISREVKFDFPVSDEDERVVTGILSSWSGKSVAPLVAVNVGAKRSANEWSLARFLEVSRYLMEAHGARIVFIGGVREKTLLENTTPSFGKEKVRVIAGSLTLLQSLVLLKRCAFLLSNDTGAVHLAAAAGIPVVGLYSVRNVWGKWFPYGERNVILRHGYLSCNYRREGCIARSMGAITVDEVKAACDRMFAHIIHVD